MNYKLDLKLDLTFCRFLVKSYKQQQKLSYAVIPYTEANRMVPMGKKRAGSRNVLWYLFGPAARSLSQQETLYSCLVQIQASGCQKALMLRLPPAKPLAADADTILGRESTIP